MCGFVRPAEECDPAQHCICCRWCRYIVYGAAGFDSRAAGVEARSALMLIQRASSLFDTRSSMGTHSTRTAI